MAKKTKKNLSLISGSGSIVFGIGVSIAIIAALLNIESIFAKQIIAATLILLGIGVGVLNITKEEAIKFMIATVVIITMLQPMISSFVQIFEISSQTAQMILSSLYNNVAMFVAPAALVVALKSVFEVAKDEE